MTDGRRVNMSRTMLIQSLLMLALGMTACSNQSNDRHVLATVNGEEITEAQLDDELRYSNVGEDSAANVRGKTLEMLVDRQLILDEAMRHELDRTFDVMEAIKRTKNRIIEQAYLRSVMAKMDRPSRQEVGDFLSSHPEYWSQRRQYDIRQIVVERRDYSDELKAFLESANDLRQIADWLSGRKIHYERREILRSTEEFSEVLALKLKGLNSGQLFMFMEGGYLFVNAIDSVRVVAISRMDAEGLAEQYLMSEKARKVMQETMARLRNSATISYTGTNMHGDVP